MILVGREVLTGFLGIRPTARTVVSVWVAGVGAARWTSDADVTSAFPSSRVLPGRLFIFEFTKPQFAITAQIAYVSGVVVVLGATEKTLQ